MSNEPPSWRCEECGAPWPDTGGQCRRCGNRTRVPAVDPPSVPDISLALHAIRREGRTVRIVAWSWWREHAEPGRDYLVLQDETYHAVMNSDAT